MENSKVVQSDETTNFKINIILLILGRAVGDMGSNALKFGISLYVLDMTGSASAFSMILGFAILPGVLVNIFAGVIIDRGSKKKFIVASDILCGIAILIFTAVFEIYSKSIVLFIVYSITIGLVQAFFLLALNSSIPEIVKKEDIARANSAFQSIGAITNVVGPVIGAIAYNTIGLGRIFLISGITFLLAGVCEMFLKFNQGNKVIQDQSYVEGLKEVFTYLKCEKGIRFLLLIVTIVNFIYIPLISLVLTYINYNQLHVSGIQLSVIQGSWTGGMILAAIFISTKKTTDNIFKKVFVILMVESFTILLWAFPKIPVFPVSAKTTITIVFGVILLAGGMLNAIINITAFTFLQIKVPEDIRARIFGVVTTANLISAPLGMAVYGTLLENVNWAYITIVSGILSIAISIVGNSNKNFKELKDYRELPPQNGLTIDEAKGV